jgi:ubiquinone/menaquinone biosynthesis C-methylase UbiE
MPGDNSDAQERITAFWSTVAPEYEAHPGNVPSRKSAEYEAWVRAIERLLPAPPADVLDIGTGTGFVALIAAGLGNRVTGLDLSSGMLQEAQREARRRGLTVTFTLGDAVTPACAAASLDAIICRHLIWTLREPVVALGNWRRLLRPGGRVVAIDGFWFNATDPDSADAENAAGLFEQHYTKETREALPAMGWAGVEPVADLFAQAGFSEVNVGELAEVHRLAENPPSAQPWYVVSAFCDR